MSDSITRCSEQQCKEHGCSFPDCVDVERLVEAYSALRAKVAELEARQQWVTVEDGEPEENEIVWISGLSPQGSGRFYADAKFYGGGFYIFDTMTDANDMLCGVVDFWQRITPPTEDKPGQVLPEWQGAGEYLEGKGDA